MAADEHGYYHDSDTAKLVAEARARTGNNYSGEISAIFRAGVDKFRPKLDLLSALVRDDSIPVTEISALDDNSIVIRGAKSPLWSQISTALPEADTRLVNMNKNVFREWRKGEQIRQAARALEAAIAGENQTTEIAGEIIAKPTEQHSLFGTLWNKAMSYVRRPQ